MRPPYNRLQQINSSLLVPENSPLPGLRIVMLVVHPWYNAKRRSQTPPALPAAYRRDPEALRRVVGLPDGPLMVLEAALVPPELLPMPCSNRVALAVLSLSSEVLYHPERPLISTSKRLRRCIVLCQPQDYHDLH